MSASDSISPLSFVFGACTTPVLATLIVLALGGCGRGLFLDASPTSALGDAPTGGSTTSAMRRHGHHRDSAETPTCVPETAQALCSRLGKSCDSVTAADNCGTSRTATCGTCTSPATCGGGGAAGVCGTAAEDTIVVPCDLPAVPTNAINAKNAPYAAKGDGVTDDTAALQAAINATPSGGTVYVPDGTYRIKVASGSTEAGISLKSNMTLRLSSGAVLQALAASSDWSAVVRIWGVTNVSVYGGKLVGDRRIHTGTGGEHGMGIDIRSSSNVKVGRLESNEMWGDGFYVGKTGSGAPSTNVTLCRCVADYNRRQGLSVVSGDGVVVDSCVFSNTVGTDPQDGIDLEPNGGTLVRNVRIQSCELFGNLDGINYSGYADATEEPNHTLVVNNVVHDNRRDGLVLNESNGNNLFRHNQIYDNARNGITLRGPLFTIESNTVSGNLQHGINAYAINDGTAGWNQKSLFNVIDGNTITDNGYAGVRIADVHENEVTNNVAVSGNGQQGIIISASNSNTIADNLVAANGQAGTYDNIQLTSGSSDNTLDGNTVQAGTLAKRPRYGINIADSSCSNNAVTHNTLTNSGTSGGLHNLGTGTVVSGNTL